MAVSLLYDRCSSEIRDLPTLGGIVSDVEYEDKPDEEIDEDVEVVESEEEAPTEDTQVGEDQGDAGPVGTV
jgi:hypothetical protein